MNDFLLSSPLPWIMNPFMFTDDGGKKGGKLKVIKGGFCLFKKYANFLFIDCNYRFIFASSSSSIIKVAICLEG